MNGFEVTPLLLAIDRRNVETVKVRPDVSDILLEKHTFVQILLEAGASIEANPKDKGKTPLHHAAEAGKVEVVKVRHLARPLFSTHVMYSQMLLDRGASKTAKDSDGHIPYDFACGGFMFPRCSEDEKSAINSMLNPYGDFGIDIGIEVRPLWQVLLIACPALVAVVFVIVRCLGATCYNRLLNLRDSQPTHPAQNQVMASTHESSTVRASVPHTAASL